MAPKRPANEPTTISSSSGEEHEEEEEEGQQKTPTKPSAVKKPSRSSRRVKKKEEPSEAEPKKPSEEIVGDETEKKLFQRLWSDDDEVAILKGMISYKEKKGSYPSDMAELLGSIKKSLGIEASASQLKDKVRRLQRKYANNAARKKFNPSKPHDKLVFELSAKIWGEEVAEAAEEEEEVEEKVNAADNLGPNWGRWSGVFGPDKGVAEYVLKRGVEGLVSKDKAAEIESRWRSIQVAELELFVKRNELLCEQTKLVLKALKSSDQ